MRWFLALLSTLALWCGPALADYEAGRAAYERGDYPTALREWRALARQGDGEALFALGLLWERGEGVTGMPSYAAPIPTSSGPRTWGSWKRQSSWRTATCGEEGSTRTSPRPSTLYFACGGSAAPARRSTGCVGATCSPTAGDGPRSPRWSSRTRSRATAVPAPGWRTGTIATSGGAGAIRSRPLPGATWRRPAMRPSAAGASRP